MKKIITLTSVFIFCFSLLPSLVHAAGNTYYVTQNGNGARNGQSLGNAWSVSDFNNPTNWSTIDNSNKIDPGDTVYFSGTITAQILPQGSGTSGYPITLDGYQAGDCDPINSVCSSSALLTTGLHDYDQDYITIQDFRGTGGTSDAFLMFGDPTQTGHADHIVIRRNYLYNTVGRSLAFNRSSAAPYVGSQHVTVENNKISGYGIGSNPPCGASFYEVRDLVVRGNDFSGGPDPDASDCKSDNVIEVYATRNALFEYNNIHEAYQQAGMALKEGIDDNWYIIIRFNKFHDNSLQTHYTDGESIGLALSDPNHYTYVYGNYIYHNGNFGIFMSYGTTYNYIWSNLITNNGWSGLYSGSGTGPNSYTYIYNNTFAKNDTARSEVNTTGLAAFDPAVSRLVKNNIFYDNRPRQTYYHQVYLSSNATSGTSLDYNTYYFPGQTPTWYWNDALRSIANMQSYGQETHSDITDPGFNDANGADNTDGTVDDDYRLDGRNINDGKDLSQCFNVTVQGKVYNICLDDALDPNATNWRTTPPIVRTVKQGANGSWSRGAYAYGTGAGSPDINAPAGLKIIVGNN